MGRERNFWVVPSIWDQPWSEDGRYLALYLLTCRHRLTEGLYKLPATYACEDLAWDSERYAEAFVELLEDGFVEYDEQAKVVLLVGALEIQPPANGNVDKAAVKVLATLPKTALFQRFHRLAERSCERFAKALAEAYPERIAESPSPSPSPTPSPFPPTPQGGGVDAPKNSRAHGTNSRALALVEQPGGETWAARHFPDGDPKVVAMLAGMLRSGRREVTPEAVREKAATNAIYSAQLGIVTAA